MQTEDESAEDNESEDNPAGDALTWSLTAGIVSAAGVGIVMAPAATLACATVGLGVTAAGLYYYATVLAGQVVNDSSEPATPVNEPPQS